MRERLVTLGLAIGALFMCYALFLPKPPAAGEPAPRPISTEVGQSGYQAAWRWLEAEHFPVSALHERFDHLNAGSASKQRTGNVLLTTLPHKLPVQPAEATQLDAWVERGNTLVVAAALDDTPEWAGTGSSRLVKDVGRLSRLEFGTDDAKSKSGKVLEPSRSLKSALNALGQPSVITIEPRGSHPLMEGVHSLRVISDLPASRWHATPMDSSAVLQVAQADGGGAIWIRRQAKGQVITLAVAGLFSNRDIGSADNAKLLSNIIAWSLQPGGSVIFDDTHQGAVGYYDAKAFYADPRLHRTLLWFVLLWLVFVLGIQRLRVSPQKWRVADVTAFVGASGEFLASSVTAAAAGNRLLGNFFDMMHRRPGARADDAVADDAAAWAWLSSQAPVSAQEVTELRQFQSRIRRGKRFDLMRLQNLLSQLKGKLL
ncbi:MAG TPA: DUF4350 domain-containing protein [Steroidobacteraceae bacterium]|nr:DUF4350 domain-containing protein [Steroidobacteraceae bacterium]